MSSMTNIMSIENVVFLQINYYVNSYYYYKEKSYVYIIL